MDFQILFCDRQFFHMAEGLKKQEKSVIVHSVFQKAVNLESEGHLYTMLAVGAKPLPPGENAFLGIPKSAYVNIQHFTDIKPVPGMSVFGNKTRIQIGEDGFEFSEHMVLFPDAFFQLDTLSVAEREKIRQALTRFDKLLPEAVKKKEAGAGFFYMTYLGLEKGKSEPVQRELEKRLFAICTLLKAEGRAEEVERAVIHTVGAGIGLTPSADDFLCGMLIAMNCMEGHMDRKIKDAVEAGICQAIDKERTTKVSAEMLLLHVHRLFPRLYKKLAEVFLCGGEGMEDMMERIIKVGHSSGIDMACGMAAAFRIFNK